MRKRSVGAMIFLVAFALSTVGIVLIYSASRRAFGLELALKQVSWLFLGVVVALVCLRCGRDLFFRFRWLFYLFGLVLLVLTLLYGREARGGRRWLTFWGFNVQTSEIAKVLVLFVVAGISEKIELERVNVGWGFAALIAVIGAPVVLVLAQPHLGNVLVFMSLLIGWFFISGWWREGFGIMGLAAGVTVGSILTLSPPVELLNPVARTIEFLARDLSSVTWTVSTILAVLFVAVPYFRRSRISVVGIISLFLIGLVVGNIFVMFLAPYQRERIEAYLNPYALNQTSGYSVVQSQIAIGSGGWFGQGYLEGTQSQLGFIPELWTDFVFTVGVEEFGWVFALLVSLLYFLLIYGAFSAAASAEEWWVYYFCSGVGLMWLFHIFIGLGMATGLTPVTGLPLPFLSYGGSFLVINWFLVGILFGFDLEQRQLA